MVILLAVIIYLWVHPLVELEYEAGIKLGQIYLLTIWLVICVVLASFFLLRKKTKDYLASDQRVYAITPRNRLARLSLRPYVVERQGDKLLISNKKSP